MGVILNRRVFFFTGVLILTTITVAWANEGSSGPSQYKKRGGIQGHPAMKRGLELGWDKGYLAGKAEVEKSTQPDPSRHEDYNDPDKWYRYEFGRRSIFIRGFRGGFLKGYSYGLQQKVPYKAPLKGKAFRYAASTDAAMSVPGSRQPVMAPASWGPRNPKKKAQRKKAKEAHALVVSDAL